LDGLVEAQRGAFAGQKVRVQGTIGAVTPLPEGRPYGDRHVRSITVLQIELADLEESLDLEEIATEVDTLERWDRDSPDDPKRLTDLGYAYFRAASTDAVGGRALLHQGIRVLERALDLNPKLAVAYNNLALIYTVLGRFARVIDLCQRAILLRPQFTTPYFGLYVAHGQLGRAPAARAALERVIEIGGASANVRCAELILRLKPGHATLTCLIATCRQPLVAQYGQSGFGAITAALQRLASAHRAGGVDSRIVYLDEPASEPASGEPMDDRARVAPIKSRLDALCRSARLAGDPVEYCLLIGGPDIVPFFEMADPTAPGAVVLSDNPYASDGAMDDEWLDHLLPVRRVGRLPGEAGAHDPRLLLKQIENACRFHRDPAVNGKQVFCYTAEAWEKASRSVLAGLEEFRLTVTSSEPCRVSEFNSAWLEDAPFLHFNLHGSDRESCWKGTGTPVWKVRNALQPESLASYRGRGAVVFSQCCFGAYINGRSSADSIALSFLDHDARCLVGSLAVAYGADGVRRVELEESDVVARSFWTFVKEGIRFGDALMRAKHDLAEEMALRLGGLDEDAQKTLLSFVLYGDPTLAVQCES